ncbi:pirin-like C-terminal cupin domain-containing protein [Bacillus sp. ISL-45]|uniref:pirin family protein n=1 Tax=Bacillus sp. ISL-45 TaxID=2819128 RepID=UPI001BE600F9|nr:pirin-like C-terminal cupin domain-containing protein [Bacillus sp. ISL-45]MBT2662039.1 pirin family protein [Bacillus sp. ISL-45]
MFKRDVKKHWTVQYEERGMPHVQAGLVLNPQNWRELDPFILMAEDWFKRGTFSDHPHRGFQTITYIIDGRLEHIDNHGGHSIMESGDIQYMNAGSGARHAEEAVDNDIAHTLQLWLNLPKELKGTATSYQNVYSEHAPLVQFKGGTLKVYSGETAGVKGPLEPLVPFTLSEIQLAEGAEYEYELPEGHNAFLYVLSGDVQAGSSHTNLKKSSAATLTFKDGGEGLSEISLKANQRSRVLVYSGKPIKEEVVAYGPFVMNSMEEIRQAYRDYQEGKFGTAAE